MDGDSFRLDRAQGKVSRIPVIPYIFIFLEMISGCSRIAAANGTATFAASPLTATFSPSMTATETQGSTQTPTPTPTITDTPAFTPLPSPTASLFPGLRATGPFLVVADGDYLPQTATFLDIHGSNQWTFNFPAAESNNVYGERPRYSPDWKWFAFVTGSVPESGQYPTGGVVLHLMSLLTGDTRDIANLIPEDFIVRLERSAPQNGTTITEYTIPMDHVTFPVGEGRWTIQYMATDASNNKETMHSIQVLVDQTPPTVGYQISGTGSQNGWYPIGTTLSLNASDPNLTDGSLGSGVNKIVYSRDGGTTWNQYSTPIQFTKADNGTQTVLYRASDMAGNQTLANSVTVKIDAQPPTGTVQASPTTLWPPNGKLVNVALSGTASDVQSGVSNIKIDVLDSDGEWVPATIILPANGANAFPWQTTIQLPSSRKGTDKNGRVYTIRITITDMAGNTTVVQTTVTVPHDQG